MKTVCGVTSLVLAAVLNGGLVTAVHAQPLGSFTWQLQPFCNRVTVNVRQDGALYTLDGFDDQCGAGQRAPLVGLATANPDGTIGFGLNIVASGGKAVNVDARITLAGLGGTWTDNAGNTGTFAFGANTGGSPRPPAGVGAGDVTAVLAGTGLSGGGAAGDLTLAVDPAVVQSRVSTACAAGQALRSIAQNGTAVCELISGSAGGDITAVNAGLGLVGGAVTGDVSLAVVFAGDGGASAAARADHEHSANPTSVAIGPGALSLGLGNHNTAVGTMALSAASGFSNTAVGGGALARNTAGSENTALGSGAMGVTTTGSDNTAVGEEALTGNTTGSGNTAVGENALEGNVTGSRNTAIGNGADVASAALVNATALGANARVDVANAIVLGSINGVNGATSSVNVGIGTTTPEAALEVAVEGGPVRRGFIVRDAAYFPEMLGRASGGTLVAPTAVRNDEYLLGVAGQGYDGVGAYSSGAGLVISASEDWTPTSGGGKVQLLTAANGTRQHVVRVTVEHDGRVGIGLQSPRDQLDVYGDIRVGRGNATGCLKSYSGAAIAGTCSSDARLKRDITPFPAMLDRVAALRPVHYFWRAAEFPSRAWGEEQTYGLVAQDVEAVLPDLVHTMPDGYKAVDYSKLPLVLLQAVRELTAANAALTARVESLERARVVGQTSGRR